MIDVRGWATRAQSRVRVAEGHRHDAAVVVQLRRAGAIPIGKLALEELGIGADEDDGPWPPARNPWALERTAGGSSSGAGAAVAAGLVPLALGTDTGGSIRLPAAMCGVVGFKPTQGRVSTRGVLPLAPTLDHVGWITPTVEDSRLVLDALIGDAAPADPDLNSLKGVRVGVVRHFFERDLPAAPEVREAINAALGVLGNLGADLVDVATEPAHVYARCGALILGAEAHAVHRRWLAATPDAFGPASRRTLAVGAAVSAAEYSAALRRRRVLRRGMAAACERYGIHVIATGVTPGVAWRIGDERARAEVGAGDMRMTFNVLGYPAMALPVGFSRDGLPLSMQLAAPPGEDRLVLNVGRAYEAACGHSTQGGIDAPRHP